MTLSFSTPCVTKRVRSSESFSFSTWNRSKISFGSEFRANRTMFTIFFVASSCFWSMICPV